MTQQINWAGQPIRPGEGYGGRPENIPGKPPAAKQQHFAVITEQDVAEIFGHDGRSLRRTEAVKLLEELTGAHRTNCYRALRLNGRFARHLHAEGRTLSWR